MDTSKQKYIVLTGAGRGIGYQLSGTFAASDVKLLAIVRDKTSLDELTSKYPSRIIPVEYDLEGLLTDEDTLPELIRQHVPQVDILLNNAGLLVNQPFGTQTTADMQKLFAVNYMVPAILTRLLIPLLQKAGGHVVNIVSMGGFQGSVKFDGLSHYSASKGALAVLTECLASEYGATGIRVNALALGAVQTEMLQAAFPGYQAPVSAAQAASFIADFAFNGHRFFNGKILPVSLSTP